MKNFLLFFSIVIFSIFIGSQITEGVLLVPFWQSLSSFEFYAYYNKFGPSIGQFYTVLTIIAAAIPIVISIYCKFTSSKSFKYALISSLLAVLFVSSFYIYFKGINEMFYQSFFSELQLKKELIIWSYWHWGRIFIECLSLVFLILAINKTQNINSQI